MKLETLKINLMWRKFIDYLMKSYVDSILKCETFACVRETEKRVKRQTKNVINE